MSTPARIEDILSMDWVKLADLRIPPYQRPERQNVGRMQHNWDIRKAGAVVVSERDAALWVIDGQTRAKVARRLGLDYLLAVVQLGLDEAGEAELFLALNRDRLRVSPIARHRAEVYALDKRAIAIDGVLADNRLVATEAERPADLHRFHAIVSAEKVFDEGGPSLLDRTLQILAQAFASDSGRFHGKLVAGLGYFLARDPWKADDAKVTQALARTTTQDLSLTAGHWQAAHSAGRGAGGGSPVHMARSIAATVYRGKVNDWKPKRPA